MFSCSIKHANITSSIGCKDAAGQCIKLFKQTFKTFVSLGRRLGSFGTWAICFPFQLICCQSRISLSPGPKCLCSDCMWLKEGSASSDGVSVCSRYLISEGFLTWCVSVSLRWNTCCASFDLSLFASFTVCLCVPPIEDNSPGSSDREAADHYYHMMGAEGRVFVSSTIVKAKETAGAEKRESLRAQHKHMPSYTPPRDSNQARWQRWCLRLLSWNTNTRIHTNTHTVSGSL